eukprot:732133-Amphidinium_carterae.1
MDAKIDQLWTEQRQAHQDRGHDCIIMMSVAWVWNWRTPSVQVVSETFQWLVAVFVLSALPFALVSSRNLLYPWRSAGCRTTKRGSKADNASTMRLCSRNQRPSARLHGLMRLYVFALGPGKHRMMEVPLWLRASKIQ